MPVRRRDLSFFFVEALSEIALKTLKLFIFLDFKNGMKTPVHSKAEMETSGQIDETCKF